MNSRSTTSNSGADIYVDDNCSFSRNVAGLCPLDKTCVFCKGYNLDESSLKQNTDSFGNQQDLGPHSDCDQIDHEQLLLSTLLECNC